MREREGTEKWLAKVWIRRKEGKKAEGLDSRWRRFGVTFAWGKPDWEDLASKSFVRLFLTDEKR